MWILTAAAISWLLPGCHHFVHGFTCRANVRSFYSQTSAARVDSGGSEPSNALRSVSTQFRTTVRSGSRLFVRDEPQMHHDAPLDQINQDGKANSDAISYDITRHSFESRTESLSTPPHTNSSNALHENDRNAKQDVVKRWLLFHLPKLQPRDVDFYSKRLVEDGFDSAEALREVVEEDLVFMKVAHQRALGKKLVKGKDIEKAKGVAKALDRLTESDPDDGEGRIGISNFMSAEEEECHGEECFDITRGKFTERTTLSLSTTRTPFNDSLSDATKENQVGTHATTQIDDYFDITQNLFPERPRAVSSTNLPSTQAKRKNTSSRGKLKFDRGNEEDFFDITRNLFPEPPKSSLSTGRLLSAFEDKEKSEMSNRPAPRSIEASYLDITRKNLTKQTTSRQSAMNTGTVRVDGKSSVSASEVTDDIVGPAENRCTTQNVDTESIFSETDSDKRKRTSETDAFDSFVDITKQHFTSERPSTYVNTGTIKHETSSGSSIESQNIVSTATQSSDFKDITKQHFSDRLSFSLLVNSGTKKESTTFGSWDESRKNLRRSLHDSDWLPMSERTKDHKWRRKTNETSAYLDNPKFSPDLCPPSFAKSVATQISSRQPLSATVHAPKEQRFNTSGAEYRFVSSSTDRQPLSSTANIAPKQRFNTSDDEYRDTFSPTDRQPLSEIANAPPHNRFKTSQKSHRENSVSSSRLPVSSMSNLTSEKRRVQSPSFLFPFSDKVNRLRNLRERRKLNVASKATQPLSLTVHSKPRRFNTVEQKSLLVRTRADLNATSNHFDVPRAFSTDLEMVTRSKGKNISSLSMGVASSKDRTVSIDKHKATSKSSSNNELPLSMTIHSSTSRFNTTQKSSSSFAGATAGAWNVGFDVPRAFIKNIDLVTHSEAKTNTLKSSKDHQHVVDLKVSPNLSASTEVTNPKNAEGKNNTASDEHKGDAMNYATNRFASTISQQRPKSDEVLFVDEKTFSTDLTRPSVNKRKPGSAMKATPHDNSDVGVDLNSFSAISDLCPPSKLKTRKQSDPILTAAQTVTVDRFLDLSARHTLNTHGTATTRGSAAVISDDPYVDVPQFSEVLSGSLRVMNLTTSESLSSVVTKHDLDVDIHQFSPASDLCPPSHKSKVNSAPSTDDLHVDRHQFSSVSDLCPPSKPRSFQFEKNLAQDEVSVDLFLDLSSQCTVNNSSRTLGSHAVVSDDPYVDRTRFSSNLSPPSKVRTSKAKVGPHFFDVTQSVLPTQSQNVRSFRDAISIPEVQENRKQLVEYNHSTIGRLNSTHSEVKAWLLSRLPNLEIDKVEVYADHLIRDGFDSLDMLEEIIDDDLGFMVEEHKHSTIVNHWLLSHLPDLEAAVVTSYSKHLTDDGFDSSDMLKELTEEDLRFMKTAHKRVLAKYLNEQQAIANVDEEDTFRILDENFFDITRDSFPTRPSLASNPNHHLMPPTQIKRVTSQVLDIAPESTKEEIFDITRDSFPNRPSLAEAPQSHMSLSLQERSRRQEGTADQIYGVVSNTEVKSAHTLDPKHHVSTNELNKRVAADPNQKPHEVYSLVRKAPRAELYQFYIDKGFTSEQASELKDFYTVWTNGALPHEKKFTCIFTCPISGEHFLSQDGEWGGEATFGGKVYWFKTKKAAMNAAAACALACFQLCNQNDTDSSLLNRCQDATFLSSILPTEVVLPSPRFRPEDME